MIAPDATWRPEKAAAGQWVVARYLPHAHRPTALGRVTGPELFPSEKDAQRRADELNKPGPAKKGRRRS